MLRKFKDPEMRYESGKSFSKGEIRRLAQRLVDSKGISPVIATAIVRRTIAKNKILKFRIPYGVQIGLRYYVSTYVVSLKRIKKKLGNKNITVYRADGCDCWAGIGGHRCWHCDAADWALDGFSVIPKRWQRYSERLAERRSR